MVDCLNAAEGAGWKAINGDSVEVLAQMPDCTVGFSIYSPPFADIFVYSESERDIGNSTMDEFEFSYGLIVKQLERVTKPGRLTAVHCSDLPTTKWKDGFIGCKDFSGTIRELHEAAGWDFVRRFTIWRDPVVEMTRSHSLNLLHMQLLKDSCKSWPGMADYVMLFRKRGDNAEPVMHRPADFPVEKWQKWASPVWMDIRQTATLNNRAEAALWIGNPVNLDNAKSGKEEKHICPLQLDLIERAVMMWSNKGDVVLSPFAGIGSEGVVALRKRRKFVGCELKPEYWRTMVGSLEAAERFAVDLFDMVDEREVACGVAPGDSLVDPEAWFDVEKEELEAIAEIVAPEKTRRKSKPKTKEASK